MTQSLLTRFKERNLVQWALEKRSSFITYLKVAPGLDPLRSDPRFDALLKKMGLERASRSVMSALVVVARVYQKRWC